VSDLSKEVEEAEEELKALAGVLGFFRERLIDVAFSEEQAFLLVLEMYRHLREEETK
jgi:hypothetical protein